MTSRRVFLSAIFEQDRCEVLAAVDGGVVVHGYS